MNAYEWLNTYERLGAPGCRQCEGLRGEEARARREFDHSRAVDCRVLLQRHPHHDSPAPPAPTTPR
ncbi:MULTISPECIES: hypothetical protein [Streptomyces]|uniref:Uncharacterized protein n=2 Tax=Streptomyces TaxID=1883 RepID=A0A8H9HW71_9ACTN|nr:MULTISPECIES: hypothetical protein [Streptomyces]WPR52251.1 hypothetical protein SJI45_15630 [Streptomyces sp. S399]WSU36620.1 hypothetical protein OG378_12855 [Streptomyces gougerotii]SUO92998.1 Uncharacterised protein [Streptomyces griseus]GFH77941.1 hypothetical protein Sgou_26110 [Streptomyces gougerotii]GGU89528.1 hypothetical protein GCM10010227_50800 [Streptomyces gougerotii]